jgi:hypothetical protein
MLLNKVRTEMQVLKTRVEKTKIKTTRIRDGESDVAILLL